MIRHLFAIILAFTAGTAVSADCRLALLLALDVSGSVDSREYRLQLGGLAAALRHPEIIEALLVLPSAPVQIAVVEWSDPSYQRILISWTTITDRTTLSDMANRLDATNRTLAPPGTALGTAMQRGAELLAERRHCWKRTLDISGDGKHNQGAHPRDVKNLLPPQSLTINALVIGPEASDVGDLHQTEIIELALYFKAWVIFGADAFIETALGFDDYENAMVRKLKRELEGPILSLLSTPNNRTTTPRNHLKPIH